MNSLAAVALASSPPAAPFAAPPLPLCAHCGLPLVARGRARAVETAPLYCCAGCALAHRVTGGQAGHGRASGLLMTVGIGAFLAMNVMMLSFVLYSGRGEADRALGEAWVRWALLALATPAAILLGAPFLARGARRLRERRLDTDALIVLGVGAAYLLSARSVLVGAGPLYLDTAMGILLFVTIGRYLEAAARARTTDALAALVRQMPETANRLLADGREAPVPIAELRPGDRVRVRPGERIPCDGRILDGAAAIAQAEITGEPAPVAAAPGARVAACTLDLDGDLTIEVERTGAATTVARIVRLVEEARAGGYPMASLVDRLAAAFVPLVLAIALATLVGWSLRAGLGIGLMNALAVLLIACPCAIGIAVPLASTAASGRAAAAGVLVRSGEVFERLARSRRVFFDKTGTLSRGELGLVAVEPAPGVRAEDLLRIAAALEAGSEHPVARAIRDAAARAARTRVDAATAIDGAIAARVDVDPAPSAGPPLDLPRIRAFRALPGRGVSGLVEVDGRERRAALGTAALVASAPPPTAADATAVHLALDEVWQGTFVLRDEPRASAAAALGALAEQGLALEILSGDSPGAVGAFANRVRMLPEPPPRRPGLVDTSSRGPSLIARGGLVPEAKLARLREAVAAGELPVMVGDGINDAPALSAAAVGVTLESGTDLAREVADVTILGGDLRRLPWVRALAVGTLRVARINLFWAFFYNLIGMALAVSGLLHPLFGAAAMIVSSLLVVVHSQRLARHPLPEATA